MLKLMAKIIKFPFLFIFVFKKINKTKKENPFFVGPVAFCLFVKTSFAVHDKI